LWGNGVNSCDKTYSPLLKECLFCVINTGYKRYAVP
jgi:hypothetical protein